MSLLDSLFGIQKLLLNAVQVPTRQIVNFQGPIQATDDTFNARATFAWSSVGTAAIPLHTFRLVDGSGNVGNIAAIGGVPASNTTPLLRGTANKSSELSWATGVVGAIAAQVPLPADVDGTADVVLELWVYSGATNAATFAVATSWDNGASVADTADDTATKSATLHKITATIDKADVPDAPSLVTVQLTPAAHATNAIQLLGARLRYTRKYV